MSPDGSDGAQVASAESGDANRPETVAFRTRAPGGAKDLIASTSRAELPTTRPSNDSRSGLTHPSGAADPEL